jgi:hypothetical protein
LAPKAGFIRQASIAGLLYPYCNHANLCFLGDELAAREHKEHKEKKSCLCSASPHQSVLRSFFADAFGADT